MDVELVALVGCGERVAFGGPKLRWCAPPQLATVDTYAPSLLSDCATWFLNCPFADLLVFTLTLFLGPTP